MSYHINVLNLEKCCITILFS